MSLNEILKKIDQRWCAHAAKIRGLPFEILAKRHKKVSEECYHEIMG